MAHEMWELKQRQSLPLNAKIQMTITRVREWYEYWINKGEDVYLSWSGGKDSTVLKHIIDTNLPYYHIKSVYVDTGLEYPEIREFVKKDTNVVILHPEKPFCRIAGQNVQITGSFRRIPELRKPQHFIEQDAIPGLPHRIDHSHPVDQGKSNPRRFPWQEEKPAGQHHCPEKAEGQRPRFPPIPKKAKGKHLRQQ